MGIRALGYSSGFDVKVLRETPGPHSMRAWKPVGGTGTECGMVPTSRLILPFVGFNEG